jgi:Protein of unknown function (DUF2911)
MKMKKLLTIIGLSLFLISSSWAQEFRGLDDSPMDRADFPDNFAHDRKFAPERKLPESALIKVIYSRPQKKGRQVFGNLVKYNEVWRLGANETTEIKIYQNIEIGGEILKKGSYAMYAIPTEKEWTIIFNSDLDEWGHYSYNQGHDVLRVKATVKANKNVVEAIAIQFDELKDGKGVMRIAWDTVIAEMYFNY